MNQAKKMQRLHLAKAQGQQLSAEDEAELKNWYRRLDEDESIINSGQTKIETGALKEKINKTTERIIAVSNEMTNLLKQNERIRLENQELRRELESRLVEKAA